MGYIAKNNARAQLAGALGSNPATDLTATLAAGKGALFAVTAPEYTYGTLFDAAGNIEHVKITARATDALTIVRAQDGSSARAWSVGDYIECRPIAAALADYAVAPQINGATAETSIADADEVGFVDASASNALKKITWANFKATLKTYFDTLYATAASVSAAITAAIGSTVQAYDAATLKSDETATLTKGYSATPYDAGTKASGTFTPDEANGCMQRYINGGAHTLAPPANNTSMVIQITNNASAGAITTSGFTKVTGTAPATTDAYDYLAYITKINGFSHLSWVALQ